MKRTIFFQILFIAIANIAFSQRTKLFQLEQKGVPHQGYAGVTNADGNQVYQLVDLSETNEIQAYGHSGTTSYTNTLSLGGGSFTLQSSSGISLSHNGSGTTTITNTGDLSTTNELQSVGWTAISSGSGYASFNTSSSPGGAATIYFGSGLSVVNSGGSPLVTATDASASNELQTFGHSGTTSYTNTLSSGGGSFTLLAGTNISLSHNGSGTTTISATGGVTGSGSTYYLPVWNTTTSLGNSMFQQDAGSGSGTYAGIGSTWVSGIKLSIGSGDTRIGGVTGGFSNRLLFGDGSYMYVGEDGVDDRLTLKGTTMQFNIVSGGGYGTNNYLMKSDGSVASWAPLAAGSGISVSGLTISNTGDLSTSNELQTFGHSGTTSYTNTLSSGGGSFTLQASSGISISNSSGTVTFTATDASASNELQSYGHSGTTSYTNTLSSGGGSFTLQAGSGIGISNSSGTVTISNTSSAGSFSTSGSLVTSISGVSGDFKWIAGSGISISNIGTSGNAQLQITATDVSASNELQTYGHSGTTSYTNTLSSGGGSFTLQASGIVGISNSSGTVTISATEVDGSTTNELQTFGHSGTTSYTNTLSSGGGSFTLSAGSGIGISNSSGTVTISATTLGTVTSVGVTAPAAGFTISPSSITSSGTFVFTLANDLAALEGLSGTGIALRTGTSTWATYDFTDLYTGFNSGEVIYTDGSITPAGSSAFTYNSGSQLLSVTSATISSQLKLTGSLCCLAPTNYVLSKRSSDGLVFETAANNGYRQSYSSSTTISGDAEFVYISGSGTYTLPSVSSSSTAGQRMFIMNNSGGNITISSPGALYVNGASGSYTLPDRTLLVLSGNQTNQWWGN